MYGNSMLEIKMAIDGHFVNGRCGQIKPTQAQTRKKLLAVVRAENVVTQRSTTKFEMAAAKHLMFSAAPRISVMPIQFDEGRKYNTVATKTGS